MLSIRSQKNLLLSFVLSAIFLVLGGASNLLVESVNYGFMPVEISACPENLILDEHHTCAGSSTPLSLLDDRWYFGDSIYSLGDGGLFLGVTGIISSVLTMGLFLIPFKKFKK